MDPALIFLFLLFAFMAGGLISGFPVAFALPGAAILTVSIAGLSGYLIAGDAGAYFAATFGPLNSLSSGVGNMLGAFSGVDKDTLIAIPLFIFMGIMLQRSKIAEDLLITMAQLFGSVPGGLGISVVLVGALLAATTGIVGATVVAMGLISLPAMLRNNYSVPLATGTICASGTLGQIIPPSIVLIILADQLGSASDAAQTLRQETYVAANGAGSMPTDLAVAGASAGDMFLGALVPGALVLVPIYVLYILVTALIRPAMAPPVPYTGDKRGRAFVGSVLLALIPPLALIFLVLGSIIMGFATVNQAGALGASGGILMAGYRLMGGTRLRDFAPVILALAALLGLLVLMANFDLTLLAKEKSAAQGLAIAMAAGLVLTLFFALGWSAWRIYRADNILREVVSETAKTTSMVFLILLGAAMLTAAFNAFGGKDLVERFLDGLPGGFFTKFLVVMMVMFVLGFFLDFIEIAVVVVPITAPILLADPTANISAVWLGVMIGLNIQTSFLTPPFGFALFYLRGVAPAVVKTTQIYRGVIVFIGLQLLALGIVGMNERLANFAPRYFALGRDTAPPPSQPALQQCLEPLAFEAALERQGAAEAAAQSLTRLDLSILPDNQANKIIEAGANVAVSYEQIALMQTAQAANDAILSQSVRVGGVSVPYVDLHREVRRLERWIGRDQEKIDTLKRDLPFLSSQADADSQAQVTAIEAEIAALEQEMAELTAQIPPEWPDALAAAQAARGEVDRTRGGFRRIDNKYRGLIDVLGEFDRADALAPFAQSFTRLAADLPQDARAADWPALREALAALRKEISAIGGVSAVTAPLSKIDRELGEDAPDFTAVLALFDEAQGAFTSELGWREAGKASLHAPLTAFLAEVQQGVAIRTQDAIPGPYRAALAWCLAAHQDISLRF